KTYDYVMQIFPSLPYPRADQLADSVRVLGATNEKVKSYEVSRMLDESFVKNAADRGLDKSRRAVCESRDGDALLDYARFVAGQPEIRRTAAGFIGFGRTRPGDRVLLAADTHFDPPAIDSTAAALRQKGARVDTIVVDAAPDREFDDLDELRAAIRRRPYRDEP